MFSSIENIHTLLHMKNNYLFGTSVVIRRLRDFEYATLRYIQVLMNKYRSIKSMVFCFQKDITVQPKKLLKVGTVGCHFAFSIHFCCFLIQLWQCDFWSCHWIIDIKLNIEFVLFEVMEMPTFTKPSDTWDSCSMYIFASNLSNNRFRVLDREIHKKMWLFDIFKVQKLHNCNEVLWIEWNFM